MFTGIITDIGFIHTLEKHGSVTAVIATSYDIDGIAIGASIACSGVCLTVVEKESKIKGRKNASGKEMGSFTVNISEESVARTNIGDWKIASSINLERALRLGDEFGGHIVSGHVDGIAVVDDIVPVSGSRVITLIAPDNLAKYVAEKGSVTLDGVSLTVNEVSGNKFWVNIIPHTLEQTTLGMLTKGSRLNMEIDMLARYVSRALEYNSK